jgi:hypothetical protein
MVEFKGWVAEQGLRKRKRGNGRAKKDNNIGGTQPGASSLRTWRKNKEAKHKRKY